MQGNQTHAPTTTSSGKNGNADGSGSDSGAEAEKIVVIIVAVVILVCLLGLFCYRRLLNEKAVDSAPNDSSALLSNTPSNDS